MNTPCKDCKDRAPKCHSSCVKYKTFRNGLDTIRASQSKSYLADGFRFDSATRIMKKTKGEHGR